MKLSRWSLYARKESNVACFFLGHSLLGENLLARRATPCVTRAESITVETGLELLRLVRGRQPDLRCFLAMGICLEPASYSSPYPDKASLRDHVGIGSRRVEHARVGAGGAGARVQHGGRGCNARREPRHTRKGARYRRSSGRSHRHQGSQRRGSRARGEHRRLEPLRNAFSRADRRVWDSGNSSRRSARTSLLSQDRLLKSLICARPRSRKARPFQ